MSKVVSFFKDKLKLNYISARILFVAIIIFVLLVLLFPKGDLTTSDLVYVCPLGDSLLNEDVFSILTYGLYIGLLINILSFLSHYVKVVIEGSRVSWKKVDQMILGLLLTVLIYSFIIVVLGGKGNYQKVYVSNLGKSYMLCRPDSKGSRGIPPENVSIKKRNE
ncbi:MAG: hypothetical protein JJV96_02025 [Alphaproteobacteria bacterium]|nr:hypothetical protein [Alphaproteobacteria bacterium]